MITASDKGYCREPDVAADLAMGLGARDVELWQGRHFLKKFNEKRKPSNLLYHSLPFKVIREENKRYI